MNLSMWDVGIFVVFFGFVAVFSMYKSRREETGEDFFLAGRGLTWPLIGFSLIAANISSEQFVGMNGMAAGECVSLSSLYAAAAFIVCGIPLDDIYMVLTPLHSQNFIDIREGVITNNRRIITKPMWFNGTAISMKEN